MGHTGLNEKDLCWCGIHALSRSAQSTNPSQIHPLNLLLAVLWLPVTQTGGRLQPRSFWQAPSPPRSVPLPWFPKLPWHHLFLFFHPASRPSFSSSPYLAQGLLRLYHLLCPSPGPARIQCKRGCAALIIQRRPFWSQLQPVPESLA